MWGWIIWSITTVIGVVMVVLYKLSQASPQPFIMDEDTYKRHIAGAVFATSICVASFCFLFMDASKFHLLWVVLLLLVFSGLVAYYRIPLISPAALFLTGLLIGFKENGSLGHLLLSEEQKREDFSPEEKAVSIQRTRKAAEAGDTDAQETLGFIYQMGDGVEQNYEEAVRWYRLAAEKGKAQAQFKLGLCYERGEGVEQNYMEAVKWYKLAADQGDADAQYMLSVCYYTGNGVIQDIEKAEKLCRKAAEQGHIFAQKALGFPKNLKIVEKESEGLKLCRKEAEEGNDSAQCCLARCLAEGNGIKQDYPEAFKWYKLAAETGNPTAQYNLGIFYMMGPAGVDQNLVEAAKWFRQAAESGIPMAQYRLGFMYTNGAGVHQDMTEAIKWMKMAADSGIKEAQNYLASN